MELNCVSNFSSVKQRRLSSILAILPDNVPYERFYQEPLPVFADTDAFVVVNVSFTSDSREQSISLSPHWRFRAKSRRSHEELVERVPEYILGANDG